LKQIWDTPFHGPSFHCLSINKNYFNGSVVSLSILFSASFKNFMLSLSISSGMNNDETKHTYKFGQIDKGKVMTVHANKADGKVEARLCKFITSARNAVVSFMTLPL
jgi:hypothetical protein